MNNFPIDEISPEFHKAWHYANSFMASAIKNEEHCRIFLKGLTSWTAEEKEFLLWAWVLINTAQDTPVKDEVVFCTNCTWVEDSCDCETTVEDEVVFCTNCTWAEDSCVCETTVEIGDLDEMTKRELDAYAREQHGVELDRSLSKTKLIKQINKIENKD